MKKTIHKGHNITRENDQSYTWAHIIESVVRNNAEKIYSKVEKNPNDISHLFSKKMVVQKMERIYEAINSRNDKEIEINNYIKKQVDSYREVDHHLGYPFV